MFKFPNQFIRRPAAAARRILREQSHEKEVPPMTEACDDRFIRFSLATESVLKAITKYKNDCLTRFGLRGMHLMTMVCLYRAASKKRGGNGSAADGCSEDPAPDGRTPGEISRLCAVDKAFVSRTTGELKRMGFLEISGGRYNARVFLTEAGQRVTEEIYAMMNDAVARITDGVSPAEVEMFYSVLDRFGKNLTVMNRPAEEGSPESDGTAPSDGGIL